MTAEMDKNGRVARATKNRNRNRDRRKTSRNRGPENQKKDKN